MNPTLSHPLQSIFWPKNASLYRQSITIAIGVLLLAFASQLRIPLLPVPLTFQSATVVLIGTTLGARYATYVIAAYLCVGLMGLPVFADFSAGPAMFFGPTLGYLLGFLPAAYVTGLLSEKGGAKSVLRSFGTALVGVSIIFLCGVSVLALHMGWQQAIIVGLLPFIVTETIKISAVAFMAPKCWKQR